MPTTIDILQEEYERNKNNYWYKPDYKVRFGQATTYFSININSILKKYDALYGKEEERNLSDEELKCMNALCKTIAEFIDNTKQRNRGTIALGTGESSCRPAIFKSPDNLWIVWTTNERNGATLVGIYENCSDACVELINILPVYSLNWDSNKGTAQKAIDYFEKYNALEVTEDELIRFASLHNYIDKFYHDDFIYLIKKIAKINEYEDEDANKRIQIRKPKNNHEASDFFDKVVHFIKKIGKKVNIQIENYWSMYDKETFEYKMEYYEWIKLLIKKVNISKYPKLVTEQLNEYYPNIETNPKVKSKKR